MWCNFILLLFIINLIIYSCLLGVWLYGLSLPFVSLPSKLLSYIDFVASPNVKQLWDHFAGFVILTAGVWFSSLSVWACREIYFYRWMSGGVLFCCFSVYGKFFFGLASLYSLSYTLVYSRRHTRMMTWFSFKNRAQLSHVVDVDRTGCMRWDAPFLVVTASSLCNLYT